MLRERRTAVQAVAAEFLKAEASVDAAATDAASCITTMLSQRSAANLPVTTGLSALRLLSEATADLVRARERFVEAHGLLVEAREGIGVRSFGDESECPPDFASPTRGLRAAKLAAVA